MWDDIWQGRVNEDYRFISRLPVINIIMRIIPHPKIRYPAKGDDIDTRQPRPKRNIDA